MAPTFSMICDISPDKDETMKMKVKVIRMWYGKPSKFSSETSSIDIVLLDEMVRYKNFNSEHCITYISFTNSFIQVER